MLSFLSKPFPFEYHPKKEARFLILLTLFPGLFLIVFKPFGIVSEINDLKTLLVILGFGLVTVFFVGIYTLLLPLLFRSFYSNFTVSKAILHYSTMIILIAIGNYVYKSYWQGFMNWSWDEFFIVFNRTLILAVIPSVLIIIWYQNYLLKKHLQAAIEFNQDHRQEESKLEFYLASDNQKEFLRIPANDLRYIESQDNYVMVYYKSLDAIEKKLLRSSLTKVEENLNDPNLIRCHRSYIINLNAVKHAKGNSRGLQLELLDMDVIIPVSRSYIQKVKKHL